jgi:hypothetical protein
MSITGGLIVDREGQRAGGKEGKGQRAEGIEQRAEGTGRL